MTQLERKRMYELRESLVQSEADFKERGETMRAAEQGLKVRLIDHIEKELRTTFRPGGRL